MLRAALDALAPLGDDRPDVGRLRRTLSVLDPALSGAALDPPGWVAATGMPSAGWIERASALRAATLASPEQMPAAEAVIAAGSIAPGLTERWARQRALHQALRRGPLFPPPAAGSVYAVDGLWWAWDTRRADGAWVRVRTPAPAPREGLAWLEASVDDLAAEVGRPVRRTTLGPAWVDADGRVRGLYAVREVSGEPMERRLAIDRALAEDRDEDARIIPFAAPG